MAMDKELKKKWVKALRSGEYKQGRAFLNHTGYDTHCCLGVLCEVMGLESRPSAFLQGITEFTYKGTSSDTALPSELVKEFGWVRTGDDSDSQHPMWRLMSMNDSGSMSFSQIADYIEASPDI